MTRTRRSSSQDAPDSTSRIRAAEQLRQIALLLVAGTALVVPLVFDRSAMQPFVLPKALILQAAGLALVIVLGASTILEGRTALRVSPIVTLLAFTLGGYALATLVSVDPTLAIVGAHDRLLGFQTIAAVIVIGISAGVVIRRDEHVLLVAVAALLGASLVGAYALVQWTGHDPFRWDADPTARAFSTTGQWTVLGQYLTTTAMALLAAAASAPLRRGLRVAALIGTLVLLSAAATSGTRAIVLGIVMGTCTLVALLFVNRERTGRIPRLLVVSALSVSAFIILADPVGARFSDFGSLRTTADGPEVTLTDPNARARLVLYEIAIRQFLDRPLLGVGPDNYSAEFPRLRPDPVGVSLVSFAPETSVHSWPLKMATDTGIVGLALYGVLLMVSIVAAFNSPGRWPSTVALVGLTSFLGTGLVTINDVTTEWLPWLCLGVIAGTSGIPPADTARVPRRRPAVRRPSSRARVGRPAYLAAYVVPVLGLGIAAACALPSWSASRSSEEARRARAQGDHLLSLTKSEHAVAADSDRARYWHGLGLSQVALGRPRAAVDSFSAAVQREPYNASYLDSLARAQLVLAQSNDTTMRQAALATAQRAIQQDPNSPVPHFTMTLVMHVLGDQQSAARAAETGLRLSPRRMPDFSVPDAAARAYLTIGRPVDAERWARLGLVDFARSAELRITLARALAAQNRVDEAIGLLDQVLRAEPENRSARALRNELAAR